MSGWKVSVCLLAVWGSVASLQAQEAAKPKRAAATSGLRVEFQPPKVKSDLPHVLLIGDSISIGYMQAVRQQLAGKANVWRPPANCGPTTRGLESLQQWLGDRKWDVIHFNFGLHDLKYMGPKDENLADPATPTSRQQVPIDQYAANLKQIAERLKKTGATVVWCETTPVPEGAAGRVPGDAVRYNEAAAKVMTELGGIEINPLHAYASEHADLQRKANVHYTEEGSAMLGKQVAASIEAALAKRARP